MIAGGSSPAGSVVWPCVFLLTGTLCYGAVFGAWRSAAQAGVAAVKMPLFVLSLLAVSGLINVILAQVLGSKMSARQVMLCLLMGLTLTYVILAAVSPVLLFFSLQCPPPGSPNGVRVYWGLLLAHTAVIGVAGLIGNVRLYRLLNALTQSPAIAGRVLISWLLVTGLAGCELSWIISPFLATPVDPVPLINPNAFKTNFFEYVWRAFIAVSG